MSRSWWTKFVVLVFFIVLSAVYVYPTVGGLDLTKTKFPFKEKINLGLDLQGGLYMVLGIDFDRVYKELVERQASSLEQNLKDEKKSYKSIKVQRDGFPVDDARIVVETDGAAQPALLDHIKKEYWTLRLTGEQPGKLEFGLARDYRTEVKDRTVNQSIEVIRNRIDEFGVAEPVIASQGTDRIVVELAGVKEVNRAKELIGRTAKLEFKIVADKAKEAGTLPDLIAQIEKDNGITFKEGEQFSAYVRAINEKAKGKIPEDTEIAFERIQGVTAGQESRMPYLLYLKTEVTGDDLQDASVAFDPDNQRPIVSFSLNPRGAGLFEQVTGAHIGERLAIVLDGIVHSAPVIQSRIGGGRGQITLGQGNGDEMMKEAKDLAIVLRAGALPAQLEFLEQRVTGPSLGQDSIRKGAMASLLGSFLVIAFIIFYYRVSGVIAAASLILNVLFVLAVLVGIEATLTLPGIAGIALTVGIAVDSNVVIYERIREELRAGKRAAAAVEAGFQKALRTIMDANVTNAAAAVILLMYGTGPIKGFAVTMLIGIITTLFTAVFVCKVFFDFYLKRLERRGSQALSI